MTEEMIGRLIYPGEIRKYIVGGNSTFTVVFGDPIGRRTFKVKSKTLDREKNWTTNNQDRSQFWVSLKTGPGDSWNDFQNIGFLTEDKLNGGYRFHPKLNNDKKMHFGAALFDSVWTPLEYGARFNSSYEFWHEGSCCICGRKLTVPESIANGIGPECMGRAGL